MPDECTVPAVRLPASVMAGELKFNPPPCLNRGCVGCGPDNAHGLRLTFGSTINGVRAMWRPTDQWESYPATVHGGIVTTVLDEAMSKAVMASGWQAFTMDIRVRFHRVVRPGGFYVVEAHVVEKRKTRILTEATLSSNDGREHACAWATFLQARSRE